MPYVTLPNWTFGDTVNADELQKYSNNLDFLYAETGGTGVLIQPAYLVINDGPATVINQYRWLYHDDNGIIRDPTGVGTDVSLANPDPDFPYYDLYGIDWMFPGKEYWVIDVDTFYEVDDPTAV